MSDPLRTEPPSTSHEASPADREARIEQLLLSGLDHYFAAEYDKAIHVWTRVIFIDRNHDRARAYIERARQAVAERQRESEELVHRGVAAFNEGQTRTARELFNEAITRGGPHDVALAFLDRLNRIDAGAAADADVTDPATPLPSGSTRVASSRPADPLGAAPRRGGSWTVVIAVVCTLATAGVFWWQGTEAPWMAVFTRSDPVAPLPAAIPPEPLPIPRTAETTLERARTLYEGGRLFDALATLDAISPADVLRPEADGLRAEIQRALLAAAVLPSSPAVAVPPRPPAVQ